MQRSNSVLAVALLAALPFVLAANPGMPTATGGDGDPAPCCFTNPRFNGVCQVDPAGDETCGSILAYLNNPNSAGRTYCANTQVRGGWTRVECAEQTAGSSPASAPARDAPDAGHLTGDGTL